MIREHVYLEYKRNGYLYFAHYTISYISLFYCSDVRKQLNEIQMEKL